MNILKRSVLLFLLYASVCSPVFGQEVSLFNSQAKTLSNGTEYFIPMNSASSTVVILTEQLDPFDLINNTAQPVVLNRISIAPGNGVTPEEFSIRESDLKHGEISELNETVPAGGRRSFYVRFFPCASGPRKAVLTVTHDGNKTITLKVTGNGGTGGTQKAVFFSRADLKFAKILGGRDKNFDEQATAMAADAAGNVYISGQTTGIDKYAYDIFIARVSAQGDLSWLKLWSGKFRDCTPDSGENDETGGPAGALAMDPEGFLYYAGAASPAATNNNFAVLVLKIDPKDGSIVWEKLWRPLWAPAITGKMNAQAYAVDADESGVYVTGTTGANAGTEQSHAFVLALDKASGSILKQAAIDLSPSTNDRGYAVRSTGQGKLYLAGWEGKNNTGFIGRINILQEGEPKMEWVRTIRLGIGARVNHIDADKEGNAYLSLDIRGAKTRFAAASVAPDGALRWAVEYPGNDGGKNNTGVVRIDGSHLYVGGRTGQKDFDGQMGDALLLRLKKDTGAKSFAAFYYSGKKPDELAEHRIKGIAVCGSRIILFGQAATGNMNGVRYWGYWYDGVDASGTTELKTELADIPETKLFAIPTGEVKTPEAAGLERKYIDAADPALGLIFQDAQKKKDGVPPDEDVFIMSLNVRTAS